MDKLKSIIDANALIQESFSYEVEEFKGDPACTITPSENESDYNTTCENVRIYAFSIKLFVNRTISPAGTDVKSEADRKLRNLVDSVLDDFDSDYTLTGIQADCPTGYTFINLFALPSVFGYAGREDNFRAAEIKIFCRVSVDVTAIS